MLPLGLLELRRAGWFAQVPSPLEPTNQGALATVTPARLAHGLHPLTGMTSRRSLLQYALAAGLTVGWAGAASASIAPPVTLEQLAHAARRVVRGVALQASSRWVEGHRGRRIVTTTRVRIDDRIGGDAASELLVETLGGQVGRTGQVVHGEALLLIGQPCFLFLTSLSDAVQTVAHFAQGHFPLREAQGALRVQPSPRVAELTAGRSALGELRGLDVRRARARILEAWNHARR